MGRYRAATERTAPGPSAIPSHPSDFACIDFVNTSFTHHLGTGASFDRLPLPDWRAWFAERHQLDVDLHEPVPIQKLTTFREQLRSMLEIWATTGSLRARDIERLDGWVSSHPLRQRVTEVSGRLTLTVEPLSRDWDWMIGRIAASAVALLAQQAPERLKACDNPDCSWMFYDHTLNRSRRFCSANQCGNVMRVRRFRGHVRTSPETSES